MTLIERIKLFFSSKERVFEPDRVELLLQGKKDETLPPFVIRKWKQIGIAMDERDEQRVNELQMQLKDAGYPFPKAASEVREACPD